MVKEATKTGYSIATVGDSINLAFPNSETRRGRVGKSCAHTLQAGDPEQVVIEPAICAMRGRNPDNPNSRTKGIPLEQRLEMGGGMSNTLTTVQKDNLVVEPTKCEFRIRKLTPRETFRLMDFDDEDFDKVKAAGVSDSQCYKQAGNSIVVAVLEAIFKQML